MILWHFVWAECAADFNFLCCVRKYCLKVAECERFIFYFYDPSLPHRHHAQANIKVESE